MDHGLPFQEFREFTHRLEVRSPPFLVSWSRNMIILKISFFVSFLSYFSLRFKGEKNVDNLFLKDE
jgi:hypothetical protein